MDGRPIAPVDEDSRLEPSLPWGTAKGCEVEFFFSGGFGLGIAERALVNAKFGDAVFRTKVQRSPDECR